MYDKFEHSSAVIVAHLHTKINHGLNNAADAVDRPPCAYEFIWPYLRPAYLTAALTLTRLSLTKGHAISADDTDHGGGGDVAIWKLPAVCCFFFSSTAGLYCCVHHDTNRPAQRKQDTKKKKCVGLDGNTKTRLTIDRKQFGGPFTTTSGYTSPRSAD